MTIIPLARAAGPPQADKKKAYDEEYGMAHAMVGMKAGR